MDRKYKAADKVKVFKGNPFADGPIKDFENLPYECIVYRKPYSAHGFDSYQYKGIIYPGYYHPVIGTYIIV